MWEDISWSKSGKKISNSIFSSTTRKWITFQATLTHTHTHMCHKIHSVNAVTYSLHRNTSVLAQQSIAYKLFTSHARAFCSVSISCAYCIGEPHENLIFWFLCGSLSWFRLNKIWWKSNDNNKKSWWFSLKWFRCNAFKWTISYFLCVDCIACKAHHCMRSTEIQRISLYL